MSKLPKRTKKPRAAARKEARAAILPHPAFIGLIVLTYIPLIAVFGLSFSWQVKPVQLEWNGINNLSSSSPRIRYFKESIKVTVYFSGFAVASAVHLFP